MIKFQCQVTIIKCLRIIWTHTNTILEFSPPNSTIIHIKHRNFVQKLIFILRFKVAWKLFYFVKAIKIKTILNSITTL